MEETPTQIKGLPDNAYRELADGEEYIPVMVPGKIYPEVNFRSVSLGLLMAVIFSAAAAYLGLKIGQVFEAAIPIAIIAVGLSAITKRKNALGENVIIQSIGASSGVIVAGAIFTLPALYILNLEAHFIQVFLSSMLGGFLGILFLIPFRKYFVAEMHGKFPFPEATATTEVLVSGEKGGSQAKVLLFSGLIGGIYDFVIATFGLWNEVFETRVIPYGELLADKAKLVFKLNLGAAIVGLGYIIGLKYAVIICAGSFVGWFVIIPMIAHAAAAFGGEANEIARMAPELIFRDYVRMIGIGGIAMAGLIGIIRSSRIIRTAVNLAVKETFSKHANTDRNIRTRRDLPMSLILGGTILTAVLIFVFFQFGVVQNLTHALVGLLIVMIIAFLFTTVAANAIAIVGTNPVSGMTLMTLILTSLIMTSVGLSGTSGMVAALIIGGVVCTALAMAGGFITDLKIGYWLGSSPYKQQSWKFLGTIVSAATVGGVIIILNQTYGFSGPGAMVAPQANAMAAVIEPMMTGGSAPWLLYGAGAFLSLILTMMGVPALAFALGMFIPLDLNTPLLVGGIISHYVMSRSMDPLLNTKRRERGTLIASGFIAGGALMGVVSALLKFGGLNLEADSWLAHPGSQWLGLLMFGLLCTYLYRSALKGKTTD
ncbi:MAG: oligopeptide transporter, OPT family [Bacteroidales bacterium]